MGQTPAHSWARTFRLTPVGGFFRRLRRRRDPSYPASWSAQISLLTLGALLLIALMTLVDAAATARVIESSSILVSGLSTVTDVGLLKWYALPAAAVFLALGLIDWPGMTRVRRVRFGRFYGNAFYAAVATSLPHLIVNTIKYLVGRARPALFEQGGPFQFDPMNGADLFESFPSGHSATCGAVAMILALWFPRFRWPILVVGAILAASRVAALFHYPSDVAAGFSIGALTALVLARWLAGRRLIFRFVPGRVAPLLR